MTTESIRTAVAAIAFELLAYFRPLGDEVFILAMVFVCNFFVGLITAICVEGDRFRFKKAWRCISEITVFFAMSLFIFCFGEKKGWNVGATQCVSFLTYIITWFYGQNILRNLRHLFREGTAAYSVVSFLYYVLSVEFIKKIPYLQEWVKQNHLELKDETTTNNNTK